GCLPATSTGPLSGRGNSRPPRSVTRSNRIKLPGRIFAMKRESRFASKALQFAYDRYIGKDEAKAEAFEAELANADVARQLYDLRAGAKLTQGQLAKLVGTSTSAISRLENAEY